MFYQVIGNWLSHLTAEDIVWTSILCQNMFQALRREKDTYTQVSQSCVEAKCEYVYCATQIRICLLCSSNQRYLDSREIFLNGLSEGLQTSFQRMGANQVEEEGTSKVAEEWKTYRWPSELTRRVRHKQKKSGRWGWKRGWCLIMEALWYLLKWGKSLR